MSEGTGAMVRVLVVTSRELLLPLGPPLSQSFMFRDNCLIFILLVNLLSFPSPTVASAFCGRGLVELDVNLVTPQPATDLHPLCSLLNLTRIFIYRLLVDSRRSKRCGTRTCAPTLT